MSWNYRVIRHYDLNGNPYLAVHDVYYRTQDDGTTLYSWGDTPAHLQGENMEELTAELERMSEALRKPVIDSKSLPGYKRP